MWNKFADDSHHEYIANYPYSLNLGITGRFYTSAKANERNTTSSPNNQNMYDIASPVDNIYLGLLPKSFKQSIKKFMQTTDSYVVQKYQQDLKYKWNQLI